MCHGLQDPVLPIALGAASRDQLLALGYAVEWREYPMQHQVCGDEIEAIGGWLREQSTRWPIIRPYIVSATVAAAVEPEIRELVDEWSEEVVGDIKDGLDLADRFAPATRHFRGVLAFEMLDRANMHWIRHQWDINTDPALDVLAEAWVKLLGED